MHFFAPANIMKLLEIVRGGRPPPMSSPRPWRSRRRYARWASWSASASRRRQPHVFPLYPGGADDAAGRRPPERVDQVAFDWGMAMGPHAVMDLSGLDVFYKLNNEWRDRPDDPVYCRMINVLSEMGRLGQKTGAGTYRYEGRKAVPDPEVMDIARREAQALGVQQIEVSDEEIIERLLYSMINEGARGAGRRYRHTSRRYRCHIRERLRHAPLPRRTHEICRHDGTGPGVCRGQQVSRPLRRLVVDTRPATGAAGRRRPHVPGLERKQVKGGCP